MSRDSRRGFLGCDGLGAAAWKWRQRHCLGLAWRELAVAYRSYLLEAEPLYESHVLLVGKLKSSGIFVF